MWGQNDDADFIEPLPDALAIKRILAHQERTQLRHRSGHGLRTQVGRGSRHALDSIVGMDAHDDVAEFEDQALRDDRLEAGLDDLD